MGAPGIFTKILKPTLSTLHKQGHIAVAHLDDLYLQGQTYEKCVLNVIDTTVLLDKLGLVVHPEKSTFIPTQVLTILGFVINSVTMTIHLTREKATSLQNVCTELLENSSPSQPQYQITTDASLMGWGAEFSGVSSGGNWSHSESKHHINYLEMLAILLGLQTFAKDKSDTHIRIMCDNTTAASECG